MGRSETRVDKLEAKLDTEVSRRHVLVGKESEGRDVCIRRHGLDPHDERHYYFVILGA